MSKSSNNSNSLDSYIDQQKALDHYVSLLEDFNLRIATLSKTLEDTITNVAKRENYIKDVNNMTKVEIREYFSTIKKTLHDMGIDLTKEATKMLKDAEKSAITSAQRTGKMSFEGLNNKTINETLVRLFTIAESGALKGKDSVTIKNFTDNKTALALLKEINTKLGKQDALESFGYKLKTFFGDHFKETKKNLALFGKDLIEGLAANKFIGGALSDTIKLIGLIGGTFLKEHFGKLGAVMGAGFVALTQVLSTLLPTILLTGIANILTGGKLFGLLGKALKAIKIPGVSNSLAGAKGIIQTPWGPMQQVTKAGVQTATFVRGTATAGSTLANIGKVGMGVAKGIPGLLAGLAIDKGANKAVEMGANPYLTHGLSGAGQGAIAGALLSSWIPIIGPAVGAAVGAAIGGIIGILKGHFTKQEKSQEEHKDFWHELLNMIKNSKLGQMLGFGGSLGNSEVSSAQKELGENATVGSANKIFGTGTSAQLLTGKQKGGFRRDKHLDIRKMTEADWKKADTLDPVYGPMGNILNLGQMSQKRAREVVAADIKAKGDKSFYERIDSDLLKKGTFSTDIEYAARGTSTKVKQLLSKAQAEGFNTSNVRVTSAIGTLGSRDKVSPHAYTSSIKGHFNEYGTTVDISNLYNTKTGKRITQADLNRMGFEGYWLNSEGDHEHIALGKYSWMKDSTSKEKQKATAEQHTIGGPDILARVDKDKYNELKRKVAKDKESLEENSKLVDNELKKHQIYYDDARKVYVTQDKKSGEWMQVGVVGGDLTFSRLVQTMENTTSTSQ